MRLAAHHSRGMTFGEWLLVLFAGGFLLFVLVSFFMPATRVVRPAAMQTACRNQLKQIGLALAAYKDDYGRLPPTCTVNAEGQPLHSWRTLLLPYLDHRETYYRLDLSKPWDDPVNTVLFKHTHGSVYRCPANHGGNDNTTYLAIRTPDNRFNNADESTTEIGPAESLIVVEVDLRQAVPWMSPRDALPEMFLGIDKHSKTSHPRGTNGLLTSGAVQHFPANMPYEERRKILEHGWSTPPDNHPSAKRSDQ